MSEADEVDVSRSREEKLKALIRKDIDPEVTRVTKNLLKKEQEGSS